MMAAVQCQHNYIADTSAIAALKDLDHKIYSPQYSKAGQILKAAGVKYKVLKGGKTGGTVSAAGLTNTGKTSVTIPGTVRINGLKYKVTAIGAGAFSSCTKLSTVTIKSAKITKVGDKAFTGCRKGMTIKVPQSKYNAYMKLFKGKVHSGTKFKKI